MAMLDQAAQAPLKTNSSFTGNKKFLEKNSLWSQTPCPDTRLLIDLGYLRKSKRNLWGKEKAQFRLPKFKLVMFLEWVREGTALNEKAWLSLISMGNLIPLKQSKEPDLGEIRLYVPQINFLRTEEKSNLPLSFWWIWVLKAQFQGREMTQSSTYQASTGPEFGSQYPCEKLGVIPLAWSSGPGDAETSRLLEIIDHQV